MALFKCVAFYNCRQRGWTETYVFNTATAIPATTDDLTEVLNRFRTLLKLRIRLAGKSVELFAIRASLIGSPNKSLLSYADLPGPPGLADPNLAYDTDNPPSTLVVTLWNNDASAKKQMHIRGIPDIIDIDGGRLNFAGAPVFPGDFGRFLDAMIGSGWGWMGRTVPHVADVDNYVQDTDTGQVVIEFKTALFPVNMVGKHVTIRLSGINRKSELNGQITVKVNTTVGCTTIDRISVFPYQFGGKGRYNELGYIHIAGGVMTKIGSRDTGAPLLQPRGRARARVLS